jgi:Ca2+-binding RTX toxin-like protein
MATTKIIGKLTLTNESLNGGVGNDTLNGLRGASYIVYSGVGDDVFYGYDGDDEMQGHDGNDALYGRGGDDGLFGGTGNDTLSGGSGYDLLDAHAGNDRLYGGDDNDTLIGGKGRDILVGGAGNDIFRLDHRNFDKIVDFNPVNDTIQLENHYFNSLTTVGTLAADSFISSADITQAKDTNDFLIYNTKTGKVYYDADANGAGEAVQIALIGNHALLTAADFVVH